MTGGIGVLQLSQKGVEFPCPKKETLFGLLKSLGSIQKFEFIGSAQDGLSGAYIMMVERYLALFIKGWGWVYILYRFMRWGL